MKSLISIFSTLLLILLSCQKEGEDNIKGQIQFSVSENRFLKSLNIDSLASNSVSKIVVSIIDEQGVYVYNNEQIELYNFNGYYLSKPISLSPGKYKLTRFLVLDSVNNIIYASPVTGSAKALLVNNPLPIEFKVTSNQVTKVIPDVISVAKSNPQEFGYSDFHFNIIKPLDFKISVFIYNDSLQNFQLTNATLKIEYSNVSFIRALSALTNVVSVKDTVALYKLTLTKPGYKIWTDTYKDTELRNFIDNPLEIVLIKGELIDTTGLVAYYPFDGDAFDKSGHNYNPDKIIQVTPCADHNGKNNMAYLFNGKSYINIPAFGNNIPTQEISVSLWARTDVFSSNFALLLTPDNGDRFGISINYYHNGVNSIFWDFGWEHWGGNAPGRLYTFEQPFDSTWHHYVFTSSITQKQMKIYRDLVLLCSKTNILAIDNAPGRDLKIGSADGTNYFYGALDEIRIYNRVISDAEIKELYEK